MRKAIGYLVLLVMLVVAMSSFHLTVGKFAPGTGGSSCGGANWTQGSIVRPPNIRPGPTPPVPRLP